jgi:hypothetical protein
LGLPFVLPDGDVGGDLNSLDESGDSHGVLAFIGMKQGQIGGPLEMIMHHEGILKVDKLLLISCLETAALLLLALV